MAMTTNDDAQTAAAEAAKAAQEAQAEADAAQKKADELAAAAREAVASEAPKVEEPKATPAASEIVEIVKAGYAFEGTAIEMGALVDGDPVPEAQVRIPLAMLNRHGLVAGATGTGKTKTLQVLAEQIAANGVPVFAADIKGDLSGIATPGASSDKLLERTKSIGQDWQSVATPTEYYALGGIGMGLPVRATIDGFGPTLLSKVLGLNATQESSLGLVFHYARNASLPLVDLNDLRDVLTHLTGDEGKAELKNLGGLSAATVGVILRELIAFADEGADQFFGQPEIVVSDFLRTVCWPSGRAVREGHADGRDRVAVVVEHRRRHAREAVGDLAVLDREAALACLAQDRAGQQCPAAVLRAGAEPVHERGPVRVESTHLAAGQCHQDGPPAGGQVRGQANADVGDQRRATRRALLEDIEDVTPVEDGQVSAVPPVLLDQGGEGTARDALQGLLAGEAAADLERRDPEAEAALVLARCTTKPSAIIALIR